jgi:hypothetical protein
LGGLKDRYGTVAGARRLLDPFIRRVIVRSRSVTLPARRGRFRAGMPGRWGSGHERAPFGHAMRAAKLVIPTPPEP